MNSKGKISVLIPLYKGRNSIQRCLESVLAQSDVDVEILMIDNGCPERTGEWAGYFLSKHEIKVAWKLLEVPSNIGFAAGMNRLYELAESNYICFLNQDVEIAGEHLSKLLDALTDNPGWGGVCGTLLRRMSDNQHLIDTTGHEIFRSRVVRNRGTGKPYRQDESSPWNGGQVFGISAACALFRKDALEAAREEEGPFDPQFFAYFEDIDLDYRMNRAGWQLGYVPDAIGTHELAGSGGRHEFKILARSYGNRRRIMLKHESVASVAPDILPILLQDFYGSVKTLINHPLVWLVGPWYLWRDIADVIKRRVRLDKKFGTDRQWLRTWVRSERDRITER